LKAVNLQRGLGRRKLSERLAEFEHGTVEYWKCTVRLWLQLLPHAAGTCKMGPPSNTEAVVNSELKVYGVKGLRVADASIMSYIVSGNTNALVNDRRDVL
jgi:choline dehydrogenase-like flavoprotein